VSLQSAKLTQTQGLVVATGAGREWLTASPHDFSEVCTLGRGAFGKVLFVKHRTNGQNYALKCQVRQKRIRLKHSACSCRLLRPHLYYYYC
jgi:hypothetical protein